MKISTDYNRNRPKVAGFRKIAKRLKEEVEMEMVQTSERIRDALGDNAPKDTGDLSRSFQCTYYWDSDVFHSYVYSDSFYLQFIVMGTGIYNRTGKGRNTPWTYFVENTSSKYYGWHTTEGMKPNPFVERTFKNEEDEIKKGIRDALKRSLKDY